MISFACFDLIDQKIYLDLRHTHYIFHALYTSGSFCIRACSCFSLELVHVIVDWVGLFFLDGLVYTDEQDCD